MKHFIFALVLFFPLISFCESPSNDDQKIEIDGIYLRGFLVAQKEFMKEKKIPIGKKDISNYMISFSKAGDTLSVLFQSKRAPGEALSHGGGGLLGRDVEYQINLIGFNVLGKTFFK